MVSQRLPVQPAGSPAAGLVSAAAEVPGTAAVFRLAHPAVARRPTRSAVARLNESTPSCCAALVLTDCPFALSQRPGHTRDEAAGRLSARWQLIDGRPHLRTHGLRPETGRSYGRKSPPLQNVAVHAQNPENTVPAFVTVYAEFKNARMPPAIWPE